MEGWSRAGNPTFVSVEKLHCVETPLRLSLAPDFLGLSSGRMAETSLLAILPVSEIAKADLVRRMGEPGRHYHTMRHLDLLWSRHQRFRGRDRIGGEGLDDLIALAIAYHDAVYVGGAKDNERRSAALWSEVGLDIRGLPEEDRLWVAETICATADHVGAAAKDLAEPRARARQWVLDLDLTPLGETAETFDANMDLLAAEVPHLTAMERSLGLLAGLRRFASARPLYRCSAIGIDFEASAQANFRRYLSHDVKGTHVS